MGREQASSFREMTPWGELVLRIDHGPPLAATLILEGTFLMESLASASERALGRLGVQAVRANRAALTAAPDVGGLRVLVGGLGLGITLREVLALPGVQAVQVVEIFSAVIAWNRDVLTSLNGDALRDPRVACFAGDLRAFLEGTGQARDGRPFDLLLLDIDNGPTWLSLPANAWLYTPEGLEVLHSWMTPAGVAAVWASERSPAFEETLAGVRWGEWRMEIVPTVVEGVGDGPRRALEYYLYTLSRRR